VSGREVCDERRAAERDFIAVVEDAIDLRGRVERGRRVPYWKSLLPPDSTTGTSASMTMYLAPMSRLIIAPPAS
jgi:hypothetical protein